MESIIEGLLYVQGDLGLTLKQIEDILEVDEEKADYAIELMRCNKINIKNVRTPLSKKI